MTYEILVRKLRNLALLVDASNIEQHIAVQINIYGECEGAFYIEITEGRVNVQPYEYFDRDALFYVDTHTMNEVLDGHLTLQDAYEQQRLVVQGNHDVVTVLNKLFQSRGDAMEPKFMKMRRLIRKNAYRNNRQTKLKRRLR